MLNDLIQKTHNNLVSELQESYEAFQRNVEEQYKNIPHLLELIEKILIWNSSKYDMNKLYVMLPSFEQTNVWFDLWLFIYNYVIDQKEFKIKWMDHTKTNELPFDDYDACPVIVPSNDYQHDAAKVILDAMNQWELNEKTGKEYYKQLHDENMEEFLKNTEPA